MARQWRIEYPNALAGSTANYTYDNDGLLTGASGYTITRNTQNGLPESVTGGALNITRAFNGYGEVASQSFNVSSQNTTSWDLIRDNNGRITRKTETIAGSTSVYDYTYDATGRLLTVTKNNTLVERYRYDLKGTRNYEMNSLRGISGRSFMYSDEDHLFTAGSASYNYDVDGFLISRTEGSNVTQYNYSQRGELLSVVLPNSTQIEYLHDPLGRRIAKKVNGAIIEKYLWHGLTTLLAVYDGSNNLLMRFQYADARMPVSMAKAGSTYYLTYDQIGSLRVVADASGNVVKRIDYDSFGNIIYDSNPAFTVPFGFAGGLHDRDTGLVRFGFRDYDPDIGRWTAKDPIGFDGGDTDLYGYVLNDPINWVDLIGLDRYRNPSKEPVFGRKGAFIEPGDETSTYLVDHIAHFDQTSRYHDSTLDFLVQDLGIPDWLANYPTMVPSYVAACLANNFWNDRKNPAENFIVFQWRW